MYQKEIVCANLMCFDLVTDTLSRENIFSGMHILKLQYLHARLILFRKD